MPSLEDVPLVAYLVRCFQRVSLVEESLGKSVWRVETEDSIRLVRCFADWFLKDDDRKALWDRYQLLEENPWSSLPRLWRPVRCRGNILFFEEWVDGISWEKTALSRESALESGKELFDLLAELTQRRIVHGRIAPQQLVLDESNGRFKLLGLFSGPTSSDRSSETDRVDLLACLRGPLRDQELTELLATNSPREISTKLATLLCDVEATGTESELVGREWAMQALNRFYSEGGLAAVSAPGGGGKSHFLHTWSSRLEDRVLRGKAEREVAPSPFQIFQRPFRQLELELEENPSLLRELRQEIPVKLPLLDSLRGEHLLERGAVRWLAKLLETLHRFRPTVLILEDAHWADPFTLRFLEYWEKEWRGAFVVYSLRRDELSENHPLLELTPNELKLPPLSAAQSERVLRSLRPTASQTFIESAVKKAAGNPFLLLQFLRSGHVQGDLEELGLSSLRSSARRTLAMGALLGNQFERSLLTECLDCEPDLTPAIELGLLGANDDSIWFVHDRFREVSLGIFHSEELLEAHLNIAQTYKTRDDPYRVAYHYRQAGRPELGAGHALIAAEISRSRDDLNTAIYYLRTALAGLPSDHPELPQANYRLGDCYRLVGRYEESTQCFLKVLSTANDPVFKADVLHVLGDVYFKQDDLQKARDSILEGLRLLGERQPVSIPLSLIYQSVLLSINQLFPRAGKPNERHRALLTARLYNRLSYVNWFLEGPVPSIRAHLCELNITERFGDSPELASAKASHAIAMSAVGWWSRACAYGEKSAKTARRIGDRWSEGRVGHFYGAVLLGAGRLKDAEDVLTRAMELLQQKGDRWEENGVRYHLAIVYYHQGEYSKARELAAQTHNIGVEIRDRLAAGDNLFTWARSNSGDIPRTALEREKSYFNPDLQRTCELLGAEAILAIREHRYEKAIELLETACGKYREKMVSNIYSAPLDCWLVTAHRLRLQNSPIEQREKHLQQAKKVAKTALSTARKFITNLPQAYRELGMLALLEGDATRSRSHLEQSAAAAETQGQLGELSVTQAVRERFSWFLGTSPTSEMFEHDHSWLLGLEKENESRQQFALSRLLQAATSISSCLSEETALHSLSLGVIHSLDPITDCAVVESQAGQWELVAGSTQVSQNEADYSTRSRLSVPIPDHQKHLFLLLQLDVAVLDKQSRDLIHFLVAVAASAVDRARNSASSRVLSQDLRLSSLRLHEEEQRLSRAKEQLLLGERLAITGRLATGLVHDLKNLTLSMTSTAEYLKAQTRSQTELQDAIADVLAAGKKATELLSHLSGLNRGEMLGARPVDLKLRILEAKPLLLSLCGPAVALNFQLKSSLRSSLDPIQLDRILLNLVVNARDAVRFGGRVTVSLASVVLTEELIRHPDLLPRGEYCRISIKDDGCGIPEEVLPQIFDLHFTTKGAAGTGVGLATVLEMVRANRGYLTVSTGAEGTLFELYFPQISEPPEAYLSGSSEVAKFTATR